MPLFKITNDKKLETCKQSSFDSEKTLQTLIEDNLKAVFNCRFIATEFSTGDTHGGRIDTLALSEDNNPVMIEYKNTESSSLVNQALYYLDWLDDHHGDFTIAVQQALDNRVDIDWSNIRVICLAPSYKKYDLHAVNKIGANIELWQYRLFDNEILYLTEEKTKNLVKTKSKPDSKQTHQKLDKKTPEDTSITHPTFEDIIDKKPDIRELAHYIREYIFNLDQSIEEVPKKFYIAYRTSRNIVLLDFTKTKVKILLKLEPDDIKLKKYYRDITSFGWAPNSEFAVSNKDEFEAVKPYIELRYRQIGG